MALEEFGHPASMVAVSCAVLILLSGSAANERRCSWCGPLAEQVHRSQRAPSCDQPGEITCDKAHPHCAFIASSPPYVESRLCVKYYQDECYSIFCNSSRAWRMTCPCRGDFCNDEKTERENEAFAFLARLGSKIQNLRIKRTITAGKFTSPRNRKPEIVNNETVDNKSKISDEIDNNLDITIQVNDQHTTPTIDINDLSKDVTNYTSDSDNANDQNTNVMNEVNNEETITTMKNDITYQVEMVNENDNVPIVKSSVTITSPADLNTMTCDTPTVTETLVIITQAEPKPEYNELSTIETPRKDINIDVANNIEHAAELSVTEKSVDDKISMKVDVNPSVEMPTAEALQQNASPSTVTEKTQTTTVRTTDTTVMMTTKVRDVQITTPDPMKMKKNNAVGISLHFSVILFWVMLYFK